MSDTKIIERGVDYYNIDNKHIIKDNRENIAESFSLESGACAPVKLFPSQEVAKPQEEVTQAPTPSKETVLRMVSQIFYNTNSTQKHKIKVRLNHTDNSSTEWIATMNKDARIFRRHNDLELARGWIKHTRTTFAQELGYKTPYYGKFHCVYDGIERVLGIQKEPECFASMAYNTQDESWYAIIAIYDWLGTYEYDFNISAKQREQGVKAQLVYTNPSIYQQQAPLTYAQRRGIAKY